MALNREIQSLSRRAKRLQEAVAPPVFGLICFEEGQPLERQPGKWDLAIQVELKREWTETV